MPEFWQFPTGSMGQSDQRGLSGALHALPRKPEPRHDAEPEGVELRRRWGWTSESLAGLSLATREGLDNLIFVVNCNLQRLDGPVRGNGSIVQELEASSPGPAGT